MDVYYLPLQKYLTCQWQLSEDRARDILQSFVADKILGKGILSAANRERGKFRTFLVSALKNYSIDQFRRAAPERLCDALEEKHDIRDTAPTAEEAFEIDWARQTLMHALEGMEAECRRKGRMDVWHLFRARIVGPILLGEPEVPYEQLVAQFGLKSPSAAFNLLLTGKRMFQRHLRLVVGAYAGNEDDIEAEIADLRTVVAKAGAR